MDYTHPDLIDNMWINPGEIPGNGVDDEGDGFVDDVHGWDFTNDDNDPMDDGNHGTQIAGIIGASGNNEIGVTGVNWRVTLIPIKCGDAWGGTYVSTAIKALDYAVRVEARVANASWGAPSRSDALRDAIHAAGQAGVLFVTAAGNYYGDLDRRFWSPASFDEPTLISVAATNVHDGIYYQSNYGLHSVGLGAPGEYITTTEPHASYTDTQVAGTSYAAAYVSGAAALAVGEFPQLDAGDLKALLLSRVDSLEQLAPYLQSGGRLNLFRLLSIRDTIPPGPILDLAATPGEADSIQLRWTAPGDDGDQGRASRIEVRYSTSPLDSATFALASRPYADPIAETAGTVQTLTTDGLAPATTYYFAARARDEMGNVGSISEVASVTTASPPVLGPLPDSLLVELARGATTTRTFSISNTGSSPLQFHIAIRPRLEDWPLRGNALSAEQLQRIAQARRVASDSIFRLPAPLRPRLPRRRSNLSARAVDGLRVLLLHSGGDPSEIQDALLGFDDIAQVDLFDASQAVPTLDRLRLYNTVIDMAARRQAQIDALGDTLAAFADEGGGLVFTLNTYLNWNDRGGRLASGAYYPIGFQYGGPMTSALGPFESEHAIMQGVSQIEAGAIADATLGAGAHRVASWSSGPPLAATIGSHVAALNLYLNDPGYWIGDVPRLVHNVATWAGSVSHSVRCTPTEGVVPPGESVTVFATFDATNLVGRQGARIEVGTNAPGNTVARIGVLLHVLGVPRLEQTMVVSSTQSFSHSYNDSTKHALPVPREASRARLELELEGDFGDGWLDVEHAELSIEGTHVCEAGSSGADCLVCEAEADIDSATYARWASDGVMRALVRNTFDVETFCDVSRHTVRLVYTPQDGGLDFGAVLTGADTSLTVRLRNTGNDDLTVGRIACDVPEFTVSVSSCTVAPQSSAMVTLRFQSTHAGSYSGTLRTESNDVDHPRLEWQVTARSVPPPSLETSTDSLSVELHSGEFVDRVITLANTGGADCWYRIGASAGVAPELAFAARTERSMAASRLEVRRGRAIHDGVTPLIRSFATTPTPHTQTVSTGPDILIVYSGEREWLRDQFAAVAGLGQVDVFNANVATPTLDDLQPYAAVVAESDYPFLDPALLGDVLADYVDRGGGLVLTQGTFVEGWDIGGRFAEGHYYPLTHGRVLPGSATLGTFDASHPVMRDVAQLGGSLLSESELTPDAGLVASWNNGLPLVATHPSGVVGINIFFGYPGYCSGDVATLIRNAALWAGSHTRMVSVDPAYGLLAPGGIDTLRIRLNAIGSTTGDFSLGLRVATNAGGGSPHRLPIHIRVLGAPDLFLARTDIDFGRVWLGSSREDTLLLANQGSDSLHVRRMLASSPVYALSDSVAVVPPRETRRLLVRFAPTEDADVSGALTIESDDPQEPVRTLALHGQGRPAPSMTVEAGAVEATLPTGGRAMRTVKITNSGGSDLSVRVVHSPVILASSPTASALDSSQVAALLGGASAPAATVTLESTRPQGWRGSAATVARSSAPSAAVRLAASPKHDLLVMTTTDIEGSVLRALRDLGRGYDLLYTCDFEHPDLSAYTTIIVAMDGGLVETGSCKALADFVARGGLLIMIGGTSYHPFYVGMGAYLLSYAGREEWNYCRGQFTVTRAGDPLAKDLASPKNFVYAGNSFYMLRIADPAATVVAMSSCGDPALVHKVIGNGTLVYFVSPPDDFLWTARADYGYLKQLLSNALDYGSGPWISSVLGTSVPAHSQASIAVHFDATRMKEGDFHAELLVESDDPDHPRASIPASLHVVAAPDIELSAEHLDIGSAFVGHSTSKPVIVRNIGALPLTVDGAWIRPAEFHLWTDHFALAPGDSIALDLQFTPTSAGIVEGILELPCDDPDTPTASLDVSGVGVLPPVATLDVSPMTTRLAPGTVETRSLSIANTGGSLLRWSRTITSETTTLKTVFFDDLEHGAEGWTTWADGTDTLWHLTSIRKWSPQRSWWCGNEATGDYSTGRRINSAVITPPIDLTHASTPTYLEFYESIDVQPNRDGAFVEISADGGAKWDVARKASPWQRPDGVEWSAIGIDLSAWIGRVVRIRFRFDTQDQFGNRYPGWFFDDVRVTSYGTPWVSVLPESGSISPGASQTLDVRFDAGGTAEGEYQADLAIMTNDENHASSAIWLDLVVDAATATGTAFVACDFASGFPIVRWQSAGAGSHPCGVERRTDSTPWTHIGEVTPDATGAMAYEDHGAVPGMRYGYRLGRPSASGIIHEAETWLDVPYLASLGIKGFEPNPANRELTVAFSLPDAQPATVELLDLAGRRLRTKPVGHMGAGSHHVVLGAAHELAGGVYYVRLRHGDRTVVAKGIIVR